MTASKEDEDFEPSLRDQERVSEFVHGGLRPTETIYQQALTSLWLGNGAAAIAGLTFIGATWKGGGFPHQLLWPLTCFLLGLISMGVGTLSYLIKEENRARQMELESSPLGFRTDYIKSPTENAGLTFKDWRTRMAIVSSALFVFGCAIGLIELWSVKP